MDTQTQQVLIGVLGSAVLAAVIKFVGDVIIRLIPPAKPDQIKPGEMVASIAPPGSVLLDYDRLVDQLQEQVTRLAARVGALEENEDRLRQQLQTARAKLDDATARIAELERKDRESQARISELERENKALRQQIIGEAHG